MWLQTVGPQRVREVLDSRDETPYLVAARTLVDRDFARAAEQLQSEGRNAEADQHLQAALSFYRSVGATLLARRAEQLLAASA